MLAVRSHRAAGEQATEVKTARREAMMQKMLAHHPAFLKEWKALEKRTNTEELVQALHAATTQQPPPSSAGKLPPHHPLLSTGAQQLQQQRQKQVRTLVRAKREMLAKQLLAEEDGAGADAGDEEAAGNATRPFPAEHGPFEDWVLTLKPAAINMSNVTWGVWRTPENSNAYSGMTEPVPNTNPFGEQIIDQDSDTYVNISDIEKGYDSNPLFAALQGKGFPVQL